MDVVNLASPINVTYNQPVRWWLEGYPLTTIIYFYRANQMEPMVILGVYSGTLMPMVSYIVDNRLSTRSSQVCIAQNCGLKNLEINHRKFSISTKNA